MCVYERVEGVLHDVAHLVCVYVCVRVCVRACVCVCMSALRGSSTMRRTSSMMKSDQQMSATTGSVYIYIYPGVCVCI